jgi:2-polyprenyl-3-methyl-5-hydroxy-6-metoxy-1,4-benzoquinol methylase
MNENFCQICHSENSTKICRVRNFQILYCKNCKNGRTFPPPFDFDYSSEDFHGNNLESATDPKSSFEKLPIQWRESILLQVEIIQQNLAPEASILEIGCGEGILLHQLALRGFNVHGVEPGINASDRARKSGLNVITGHFPEDAPPGPFHGIILSHVLEHLESPGEILQDLLTRNPEAHVFLVQTNFQGVIPRLRKTKWYAWAPEQHFWHFSTKGITHLARNHGYEVTGVTYSSLCHQPILHRFLNLIASWFPNQFDQMHITLTPSER